MGAERAGLAKVLHEGLAAMGDARTRAEERGFEDKVAAAVIKQMAILQKSQSNLRDYDYDEELGMIPAHEAMARRHPGMYDLVHKRGAAAEDAGVKRVQDWNDNVYIASKAMGIHPTQTALYRKGVEGITELGKAMNVGTNTAGGHFVPTDLSAQVIDLLEAQLQVATFFQSMDMPTNPFKIPQKTGRSSTYYVNESVTDSPQLFRASSPAIAQLTLDAKKFANRVNLSDELTEDGIVAMLPFIREDIASSQARSMEDTLINGDTTATHQDSDVTDVDDPRTSMNGIRKLINSGAKYDVDEDGSGALDIEDFRNVRKLMTVGSTGAALYGQDPANLIWLTSVHGALKIMNAVKAYVTTIDVFGDKATILRGTLAALDGIPLVASEFSRVNLNAVGVYDGSVTTKTQVLCINKTAGIIGRRRQLKIEQDRVIGADQTILVSTQRFDFQPRYPSAENPIAAMNDITA